MLAPHSHRSTHLPLPACLPLIRVPPPPGACSPRARHWVVPHRAAAARGRHRHPRPAGALLRQPAAGHLRGAGEALKEGAGGEPVWEHRDCAPGKRLPAAHACLQPLPVVAPSPPLMASLPPLLTPPPPRYVSPRKWACRCTPTWRVTKSARTAQRRARRWGGRGGAGWGGGVRACGTHGRSGMRHPCLVHACRAPARPTTPALPSTAHVHVVRPGATHPVLLPPTAVPPGVCQPAHRGGGHRGGGDRGGAPAARRQGRIHFHAVQRGALGLSG